MSSTPREPTGICRNRNGDRQIGHQIRRRIDRKRYDSDRIKTVPNIDAIAEDGSGALARFGESRPNVVPVNASASRA